MNHSRRRLLVGLGTFSLVSVGAARVFAGDGALDYALKPQKVGDGIWMLPGANAPIEFENGGAIANIVIIDTPKGAVLVDCGPSLRFAQKLKTLAQKLTGKPVVRVYVTHLHPDHGLGLAAFSPGIVAALPATIAEIKRDGQGFSDAMYRMLNDWMRGTDLALPGIAIEQAFEDFGGRRLKLLHLQGHSGGDLALIDEKTGLLIAGDLVFYQRAPSTPTADIKGWIQSLKIMAATPHAGVIPGHGPFDPTGVKAIAQTQDWLGWLDGALKNALLSGLSMPEAANIPIPARFAHMAAARYEVQRSVAHLYPVMEDSLFPVANAPA